MKYCEKCNAINLNEQIFCRKCKHQFEDFDWNSIERENIYSDSLNNQYRDDEREIHEKHFNISLKKDGIKFIIWTIICLYGIYYGLNNSWICYYISFLIYLNIILFKYYKLFFKIFDVKLEEKIGNKTFNNYRLESKDMILAGIIGIMFFYPLIKIFGDKGFLLFSVAFFISILYILLGIDFFIRSDVFNQYNDNYYVITVYSMFIMPATALFGFLSWGMYVLLNNLELNFSLIIIYLIILSSILFLDKINKYTKYDIRSSESWFLFYAIGAPFIPVVLAFICLYVFGI